MSNRGSSSFRMTNPERHLSLNSAAALVPVADFKPHSPRGHEWQDDAFAYNILIGEVGALHALTAEMVAACNFAIIEDDEDQLTAKITSTLTDDPRATRVMRAFTGPVGGQKELKRSAALHYQIAGESILAAFPQKDQFGVPSGISWEFLSVSEIRTERKKIKGKEVTIVQRNSGGEDDGFLDEDASLARWWRRDPQFSGRADSPMRRVLPICRELVVLSEVVDAIAKSRLNAGMLVIPDELSLGPDDETLEQGDEVEGLDKFILDLTSQIAAPVEDRTSAASLVPLVLQGSAEFIDKIKMVWLSRDLNETYQTLRAELLVRIAQGLDAPPEVVTGKASLNHWSAFSVDTDFINKYVAPVGEALCQFLTVAYLRRMLVQEEGLTPEEAQRFRLVFDTSPLAHRSDEAETAAAGWDRILISDEVWLTTNGYTNSHRPGPEERKRRVLEKLVFSAPGLYGQALLPVLYPELADVMPVIEQSGELERRDREARGPATPQLADPNDAPRPEDTSGPANGVPDAGPPTERPDGSAPEQRNSIEHEILVDRLATAADAALTRALERAANRVLTKVKNQPLLRDRFSAMPKNAVMSSMTTFDLRTIKVDPSELLNDAWDGYSENAHLWIAEWASSAPGVEPYVALEVTKHTVTEICRALDVLLHGSVGNELTVGKNGLRVPSSLISKIVDRAALEIRSRS